MFVVMLRVVPETLKVYVTELHKTKNAPYTIKRLKACSFLEESAKIPSAMQDTPEVIRCALYASGNATDMLSPTLLIVYEPEFTFSRRKLQRAGFDTVPFSCFGPRDKCQGTTLAFCPRRAQRSEGSKSCRKSPRNRSLALHINPVQSCRTGRGRTNGPAVIPFSQTDFISPTGSMREMVICWPQEPR
jgi:hypothetical protein